MNNILKLHQPTREESYQAIGTAISQLYAAHFGESEPVETIRKRAEAVIKHCDNAMDVSDVARDNEGLMG